MTSAMEKIIIEILEILLNMEERLLFDWNIRSGLYFMYQEPGSVISVQNALTDFKIILTL